MESYVTGKFTGATFLGNQAWAAGQKVPLAFPEDQQAILTNPKIKIPENEVELPKNVKETEKMIFFK